MKNIFMLFFVGAIWVGVSFPVYTSAAVVGPLVKTPTSIYGGSRVISIASGDCSTQNLTTGSDGLFQCRIQILNDSNKYRSLSLGPSVSSMRAKYYGREMGFVIPAGLPGAGLQCYLGLDSINTVFPVVSGVTNYSSLQVNYVIQFTTANLSGSVPVPASARVDTPQKALQCWQAAFTNITTINLQNSSPELAVPAGTAVNFSTIPGGARYMLYTHEL